MNSEKDVLGEKLRSLERAREDLYFARVDAELIEKMRERAAAERAERLCPQCHEPLEQTFWRGLDLDLCPDCRGFWLDSGDIDRIDASGLAELGLADAAAARHKQDG